MKRKLVYGWGINDADYIVQPKQLWCPYYMIWLNMLRRCHSLSFQKENPTYKGCKITSKWKSFSAFRAWMETQDWTNKQLDKDFLGDGKLYSPDTCCFVPKWLNVLFTDHGRARGKWPLGITKYNKQRFRARININGERKHLGFFDTPEEAHQAYLKAKAEYVRKKMKDYPDVNVRAAVLKKITQLG